jgi:hypothetical protein
VGNASCSKATHHENLIATSFPDVSQSNRGFLIIDRSENDAAPRG